MNPDFFDFDVYDLPDSQNVLADTNEVLVVVRRDDFLLQETLLKKILTAVKLDLDTQVTFLQLEEGAVINLATAARQAKKVFTFGLKPTQLGLNGGFRGYRFYKTESFSLLFSHSLKDLSEKPAKKKALWDAMKAEFLNS